ncbi:iron-sulfur cluster assembly protein [Halorubrum salsamenti]|uniref:iron-sulfur cluster assembly protein n=1 Tax=Halorubrum salsamenti TaxID=2583990 RepID=UPI0011A68C97
MEALHNALTRVEDPVLDDDIVSLGLVGDIEIDGDTAHRLRRRLGTGAGLPRARRTDDGPGRPEAPTLARRRYRRNRSEPIGYEGTLGTASAG